MMGSHHAHDRKHQTKQIARRTGRIMEVPVRRGVTEESLMGCKAADEGKHPYLKMPIERKHSIMERSEINVPLHTGIIAEIA